MPSRRSVLALLATAPAALSLGTAARAGTPETYAEGGVAINGYDPIGYFANGAPVRGDKAHSLMWRGATWHFASAENRALFESDPVRWAPQYGGYCAYAVSQGYTATTDPDAWSVVDDKLYLNYSRRVRRIWARDIPGHIRAADANWPAVLD
ncbi:YHS domain protein [Rhodobacteraceae bacterium CCMM004]|nr:YHS domain protein [Rhodobacteraceae bacterium CCMM004]